MKAWRLDGPGALHFDEVPDPEVRPGAVRVRMEASSLLSYLGAYVSGELGYLMPPKPFTPGGNGVGVVEAVGPDVWTLRPGQRVVISPHVVAAENSPEPPQILQGLTAAPQAAEMLAAWPDGTLAEKQLVPASALTAIPIGLDHMSAEEIAPVSRAVVPYGGLLRARLAPGETVVIHGATGAFGSAAVLVATAMGARVVAAGRNPGKLAELGSWPRVTAVPMTGSIERDTAALRAAAGGGAHCALDMVGRAGDANGTLATLGSLRRGGRLVLMGSMRVPLPIDYNELMLSGHEIIGNYMYPPKAVSEVLDLAAAGLLDFGRIRRTTFALDELPAAIEAAGAPNAPLVVMTVR
ncbi:zinc-binding dehydrogenase [Amycolatopsis taiwanensis]|uniref:Alcohol dehydrogenase n=1 Tax=Amycolatopsis taiwanensis TaxID=342230 RepID=A0A9W6QUI3_9PSEU|nr:zinc-binding dehydrogenase [Amycolatopsis taiwanensis]GLY64286.1 alcohol dehydrogenase [Amycolatopsis taiwanensis]